MRYNLFTVAKVFGNNRRVSDCQWGNINRDLNDACKT